MARSSGALYVPDQQLITNSNFDIWQRGPSGQPTTALALASSFVADRFYVQPGGASFAPGSVVQDNTPARLPPGARFNLGVIGSAGVTTCEIGQVISNRRLGTYKQPLQFSVSLFNNTGAAFTPNFLVDTPNTPDAIGLRTWVNRFNVVLPNCPQGQLTRLTTSFDPSAYPNIANGLRARLLIPTGRLTNASQALNVSQFSLKPAVCSPLYIPPDPDDEAMRCLAYTYVLGGDLDNDHVSAGNYLLAGGMSGTVKTATTAHTWFPLPTKMHIMPSLITVTGGWSLYINDTTAYSLTGIGQANYSMNGMALLATIAGGTPGQSGWVQASNDVNARIAVGCEMV